MALSGYMKIYGNRKQILTRFFPRTRKRSNLVKPLFATISSNRLIPQPK